MKQIIIGRFRSTQTDSRCRSAWKYALLLAFSAQSVHAESSEVIARSLQALATSFPESARMALEQIPDPTRRLLAARSYARAGAQLQQNWSWSTQESRAFEQSADYQRMQAGVQLVTREFEKQNPGYSLYVNMQARPVELQIERWNSNRAVGFVARELYRAVSTELQSGGSVDAREVSAERLKTLLVLWRPSPAAPLAAPGTSAHGQLRALDFQVLRGEQLVAVTSVRSVASVWQRDGWAKRLERAVLSSGAPFIGPLRSPNEPWHYTYHPHR